MVSRLPVIDDDGEVGDLSEVDPALFKPFQELPASLQAKLRGRPNLCDEGHNRLIDEMTTVMLAEFDAETRFRLRTSQRAGREAEGLALLDKALQKAE